MSDPLWQQPDQLSYDEVAIPKAYLISDPTGLRAIAMLTFDGKVQIFGWLHRNPIEFDTLDQAIASVRAQGRLSCTPRKFGVQHHALGEYRGDGVQNEPPESA